MEKKPYLINFKRVNQSRGITKIIHNEDKYPLKIKRIYTISDVPQGVVRGNHAHYKTKQLFFVLKGKVKFGFYDKGKKKFILLNDSKKHFIFIPNKCFHWMEGFSEDCIVCVAANTLHDKKDYIYDYSLLYNDV